MPVHQFIHFNIIYKNLNFNSFTIKISKVAVFVATRSQFDLKIAIRLVAVPLVAATATHLKIQLS